MGAGSMSPQWLCWCAANYTTRPHNCKLDKAADQSRARFISRHEEVKSYKQFEYPYFKVYVGDFRTRSEALKFLKEIEYNYPDAFIREDIVEFPK